MPRQIFVNLPIKNMEKSQAFFRALGFDFNPQFTNEQGACLVIEKDSIYAMLLVEPFFQTFIKKSIADAHKTTEVLICISCDSRADVDAMVKNALGAGGKTHGTPQDHGFMYMHGFEDLDGHLWEVMWMNPDATPPQM